MCVTDSPRLMLPGQQRQQLSQQPHSGMPHSVSSAMNDPHEALSSSHMHRAAGSHRPNPGRRLHCLTVQHMLGILMRYTPAVVILASSTASVTASAASETASAANVAAVDLFITRLGRTLRTFGLVSVTGGMDCRCSTLAGHCDKASDCRRTNTWPLAGWQQLRRTGMQKLSLTSR